MTRFRPRYRLSLFILGLFAVGAVAALVPVMFTVSQGVVERQILEDLARAQQIYRRLAGIGPAFDSPSISVAGFAQARERTFDQIEAELGDLRELLLSGMPATAATLRSVAAAMRVLSQWRALPAADVGDALDQQYRSVSRLTTMEAAAAAAVQVDRIQTSLVAHSAREAKVALGALLALLLVLGLIAAVIVVDVLRPLRRWALELVRRPPQATTRELVPDHVVEFAILGDALEARRDQVAQALSQLEVANRELAQIVHSLSHDLRSPLITVAGFTGVVRRELIGAHTPDVARALDDISEATRTMERLLARVLDWARAGRITLRPEPVSIAELTREATRSLAARIDATGTAVSLAGEDLLVWGDSVGLASVLRNLLDNAIACAGAEGQAPRVFVRASDAGATQCIEVSDNGPGINASARARIFEPFERFGRDTEGVGLGLTITRRYVERHGGSIEVLAGEGGKGARFRVLLPARGSPGAIARGGDADPAP